MARTKVKLSSDFFKRFDRVVNRAITKDIVNKSVKPILDSIKSGKNPKTGRDFKSLDPKTVKRRKRLATVNKTSSNYSPARSNVTFTGELLDSINAKFKKFKKLGRITIFAKGTHSPYKLIKGGRTKSVKNQKIIQGLEAKGFKVLDISKKNIELMKKELIKLLKKKFKQ